MFRMRLKLVKIIVLEFIQWAALASTVFVTAQKLATVYPFDYWVVIAVSIGYVAASTLIIWIPVKLVFQWKKWWTLFQNRWCPSIAVYFILGVIPCCIMPLVGISVSLFTDFQSVCAELLVIMLMVVDIAEKLKNFKLRSDDEGEEEVAGLSGRNSAIRRSTAAYSMISTRSSYSSEWTNKFFVWTDQRPVGLFENFLAAYDVRLILGMADVGLVGQQWYFAVYIVTVVSMASFVLTKQSKYKLSILCIFSNVTNVLFLLKNLAFISIFLYFWVIRPNVFKQKPLRQITVNSVNSTLPNGDASQNAPGEPDPSHREYEDRSRADTFDDYPEAYGHDNRNFHYYPNNHDQEYLNQQQIPQYRENHQQHSTLVHQDSNEITVHYSLDGNPSASEDSQGHVDSRDDSHYFIPDHHEEDVGPHQIRRISKKSSRKSIIKTNVFSPPEEETSALERDTSVPESPYAIIAKTSNRRKAAPEKPPLSNSERDPNILKNQRPSTSHSEEELPPPPADFQPTFSGQYAVGPHRYSIRNSRYTPEIASQIAHEVVSVHHNKQVDDDESLDVQL